MEKEVHPIKRQMVLRIIDPGGATIYMQSVPLSDLGIHKNAMAPFQLRVTIEPIRPLITELAAMNLPPWGDAE